MINSIDTPTSRETLIQIFAESPPVSLLPELHSGRWSTALSNPRIAKELSLLMEKADAESAVPLPPLTDKAYREFAATGMRLPFERIYFERRRRLARAAVALLAEPDSESRKGSFLEKLEDIFSEPSWTLPAHVRNETGRDPFQIGLFSAETANLMGECYNVFGAILPQEFKDRIQQRIRQQFLENYLDPQREPGWTSIQNNWNAVCHQGVLGAALSIVDDPELLADLLIKASRSLPLFLEGYGPDGGCSEGPSYWEYGFGWFAVLNEQLETRTRGRLSLFAGNSKISAIAQYGPAVTLHGRKLVNFADANADQVLRPSLLAYLGNRLEIPACRQQAIANYRHLERVGIDFDGERSDLFYLLRLILNWPSEIPDAPTLPVRDHYFEDLAVWVVRGTTTKGQFWELAAKGGHNQEHHNHNDLGSFLLNIDGLSFLSEIGAPEYTRDFFDPETRYSFSATRTLGHSLPLLNGHEQRAGIEYRATLLRAEIDTDPVTFSVDLTHAYPDEAQCSRFIRTLTFSKKNGELRWTDEIDLSEGCGVESALISHCETVRIQSPRRAILETEGSALHLHTDRGLHWDRIETLTYRDHATGEECAIRRLVLCPDLPGTSNFLGVTISQK